MLKVLFLIAMMPLVMAKKYKGDSLSRKCDIGKRAWEQDQAAQCCEHFNLGCPCEGYPNMTAPCPSPGFLQMYDFVAGLRAAFANTPLPTTIEEWVQNTVLIDQILAQNFINPASVIPTKVAYYGGVQTAVYGGSLQSTGKKRYILHAHGGAYISGNATGLSAEICSFLSIGARATVISVNYTLAPEAKLPAQTLEVIRVYKALLEETTPDTIALAGDSAGGGLMLLVLQQMVREGLPVPSSAVFLSGWFDLNSGVDSELDLYIRSVQTNAFATFICSAENPSDEICSPLHGSFSGLPPLLFLAARHESFAPDIIKAFKKQRAAGGKARIIIEENLQHMWALFTSIPEAAMTCGSMVDFLIQHW